MKIIKIIIIAALAISLSGCFGTNTMTGLRSMRVTPDYVEMHMSMNDFEFIGDTKATIKYNVYIGLIPALMEVNGKEATRRNVNTVETGGTSFFLFANWTSMGGYIQRALYDVKKEFPDAEILVPVMNIMETERMFLGKKNFQTLTVRAYKLKK